MCAPVSWLDRVESGAPAPLRDLRSSTVNAPAQATEIRLASRPHGVPTDENFEIVDTEVPTPGANQILVRNLFMSVDPAMRGRMRDVKSYAPPFEVGEVMSGGAVGE